MGETIIAWTDRTANFWIGCQKVSAGCKNCYAELFSRNRMGLSVWGPPSETRRQMAKAIWSNVPKWNAESQAGAVGVRGPGHPLLVFTGSMMDWAEDHPQLAAVRHRMWDVIRAAPHLTFQLLTKRPERIAQLLPRDWGSEGWPNVWLGTSIEDLRVRARADYLRAIPAVVRFISYEPALGPLHDLDLEGIDWVIYGGESGPDFRPHDLAWPRGMRAACERAGVAFFFKQSSAYRTELGTTLDGQSIKQFPVPRRIRGKAAS